MKEIGIYCIKNKINNKVYIGSSISILIRFKHHLNSLKRNKHHSIHLQRAFNKYSEENFEFIILEKCKNNDLIQKEEYYINKFKSNIRQYGYNIESFSKGRKERVITQEWRNNMSKTRSIKWKLYDLNNNIILKNKSTNYISNYLNCSKRTINYAYNNNYILMKKYIVIKNNDVLDYSLYNKLKDDYELNRGIKKNKKIYLINENNTLYFNSIKKASESMKCSTALIHQSLNKKSKIKGYNAYYDR